MSENKIYVIDHAVYFDPEIWGAKFWFAIESVLLSCDISDVESVENTYLFLISLQHTIPCPTCRKHYQHYIKYNDIQELFESKRKMFFWLYKLQNKIKKTVKKKPFPSFRDYLKVVKNKFDLREDEMKL